MNDLLYPIEEVFSEEGYLKANKKANYYIPEYQRGYKWKSFDVTRLLDDINDFRDTGTKFYCLQNITLVPNKSNSNYFNVVDGQQRLTTLTIILACLGEYHLVRNKVIFPEHSIRKETNRFINELVTNEDAIFPEVSWEKYIETNPDFDHQDVFYLFNTYNTVIEWLEEKQSKRYFELDKFKIKLLNKVKFIINKIDNDNLSEEKIFGNLNSKRVPLDGADLVRAIIITRVDNEEGEKITDIKNIVRVNEKRVKLGWELDEINRWWSKDNVISYFDKLINIKSEEIGSISLFNKNRHPINRLYEIYAEKKGENELTLRYLEKESNNAVAFYKSLLKLHNTLQDWYNDRELYHYIGFLFNHSIGYRVKDLWDCWIKYSDRKDFKGALKEKMKEVLMDGDDLLDYKNLDLNWYKDYTKELTASLILLDIISVLDLPNYAFIPASRFNKQSNDIEHIFPQNPQEVKDKKGYIAFLNEHYIKDKRKSFDLSEFDFYFHLESYQQKMEKFINKITDGIKINAIGNLVLLYNRLNNSISNSPYEIKRARIIEYYNEGNYIQPHTFRVFVRYFNDADNQNKDFQYWTNSDIKSNSNYIDKTINNFFNIEL